MMTSPRSYISQFENVTYEEMIKERDRLIRYIRKYEKLEKAGDRTGEEWRMHPRADVRYQVYLSYLAELCELMREKYNKDYVWGDKRLSDSK